MNTETFLEKYLPLFTKNWAESLNEVEGKPMTPDQLQRFGVDIVIEYLNTVAGLQCEYFPAQNGKGEA